MGELKNKSLVVLGDSLFRGNRLDVECTWPNLLAQKENMTVWNYGINGNTLAYVPEHSEPMCRRFRAMVPQTDYMVLLGGANDKRLNVPLGEDGNHDETTFTGALRILAEGLTEMYPKARILFMTSYDRRRKPNALGLRDIDYADAMLKVAAEYSIPCFDNYRSCGLNFHNPAQQVWMDEGRAMGEEKPNYHFSAEAYQWLLPKYEQLLRSL